MFGFLRKLVPGGSSLPSLSPEEAQKLIDGGAILIDVRSAAERQQGYIRGSRHIALAELPDQIGSLPKDRAIICQCASGMRSANATKQLLDAGLDAHNLEGGLQAWQSAGLPVQAD